MRNQKRASSKPWLTPRWKNLSLQQHPPEVPLFARTQARPKGFSFVPYTVKTVLYCTGSNLETFSCNSDQGHVRAVSSPRPLLGNIPLPQWGTELPLHAKKTRCGKERKKALWRPKAPALWRERHPEQRESLNPQARNWDTMQVIRSSSIRDHMPYLSTWNLLISSYCTTVTFSA